MNGLTLATLLFANAPDNRPIALQGGNLVPFGRFVADVRRLNARFRLLGCRRAALICQDSYLFAVGLLGLLHADVEVIFPPNSQPGTIEDLRGAFDLIVDDLFVSAADSPVSKEILHFDPEKLSLIFLTSGSTSSPKRIVKSAAMLIKEAETLQKTLGKSASEGPVLATVSHQHVYGLSFKIVWPLMSRRLFVAETFEFWEQLVPAVTSGSVIVSSPAHLSRLGHLHPLSADRRPSLILSAGAPLASSALPSIEQVFGRTPTEILGSTETGAFASRILQDADVPWEIFPGVSMRADLEGRLSLRSPYVAPDWYETDDIVDLVSDTQFHLKGRADRVVKIEGVRVSLDEVENRILALPEISAAVVVLLQAPRERLAAAVVLTEQGEEQLSSIGQFRLSRLFRASLLDKLAPAALPKSWRFVRKLPHANMGKRSYKDVISLFGDVP